MHTFSEADIEKIAVGDSARTTLDASSGSIPLSATVISIDPAETMTNGVGAYKVTLQFNQANPIIKSGMTATVDILTAHKDNVLAVPASALVTNNNQTSVLVSAGSSGQLATRQVTTGISGNNGYVEITSGLSIGEKVLTFGNQQ